MSKWFCLKKKSKNAKTKSSNTTSVKLNLTEERLKQHYYADEISSEKKSKNANAKSSNTTSTTFIPSSLASDLDKLNITEERLKRYADEANTLSSDTTLTLTTNTENELRTKALFLREKAISKTLNNIKRSMEVDLCFTLDCTPSMGPHIAAAKDCILQVSNYIKHTNPSIELRVGFCGYRDHDYTYYHMQLFDFTNQYEQFKEYMQNVSSTSFMQ